MRKMSSKDIKTHGSASLRTLIVCVKRLEKFIKSNKRMENKKKLLRKAKEIIASNREV